MDHGLVAPMQIIFCVQNRQIIGDIIQQEQPCGKTGGCRQIGEVFMKER